MSNTVMEDLADAVLDTLAEVPLFFGVVFPEQASALPQDLPLALTLQLEASAVNPVGATFYQDDRRTLFTVQIEARRTSAHRTSAHAVAPALGAVMAALHPANAAFMARLAPLAVVAINPPRDADSARIVRDRGLTDVDIGIATFVLVFQHRCKPGLLVPLDN